MNTPITPQTVAEPRLETHETKSKGEKLFNRFVYGGLAGVGTFFVTLFAAYELVHGRGRNFYNSSVKGLSKYIGEKAANIAVQTTVLMQGGNLMVLPVLWLENRKVKIVSGLNVMLGDKTPPEAVEQSPKQTATSLAEGRALAWGAVFVPLLTAYLTFEKTYTTFVDEFAQKVYRVAEKFNWNKPGIPMANSKAYRFGTLGAIDVFATAAAATLLYIGGHFFARKQEERHMRKELRTEGVLRDGDGVSAGEPQLGTAMDKAEKPTASVAGARAHGGTVHATGHELSQA